MYFVRIACNQFGNNGLNASADYMILKRGQKQLGEKNAKPKKG